MVAGDRLALLCLLLDRLEWRESGAVDADADLSYYRAGERYCAARGRRDEEQDRALPLVRTLQQDMAAPPEEDPVLNSDDRAVGTIGRLLRLTGVRVAVVQRSARHKGSEVYCVGDCAALFPQTAPPERPRVPLPFRDRWYPAP